MNGDGSRSDSDDCAGVSRLVRAMRRAPPRARRAWAVVLLALAALVPSCVQSSSTSVLHGLRPERASNARDAERVTDGVVARKGDPWDGDLSAVLRGQGAEVVWDLGKPIPVVAAFLQGDANDEYVLSGSTDGKSFSPLWVAGPEGGSGLQPRATRDLKGEARWVRLSARGGDGSYSVTELQLFSESPETLPSGVSSRSALPPSEGVRSAILIFGLALALWVLLTRARGSKAWALALSAGPLVTGWRLVTAIAEAWPVGAREVSMVRATAAAVAAVVVARELLAPADRPASRAVGNLTLLACAVMAISAFFNLGHPQFWDHGENRPQFIHNTDMRVYYPVAKYFPELRFDGLYPGSVLAHADGGPGRTLDALGSTTYRDLRTHRITKVSEARDHIDAVRRRFSPERWEEFVRDMRYFREDLGTRDYLGTMHDHGGNATPVWLAIAHLIFAKTQASDATLFATAMLDPALLLLAFLAVWRAFGLRTMLVSAVVFGANDFYMFGSNWAGATLRHDWMAYLALGLCALRLQRWVIAGAFLALAGMIRAFPTMALLALALPAVWWFGERWFHEKRWPGLGALYREQRPVFRVALGAAACITAFVGLSATLLGPSAWPEWYQKVSMLSHDPHVNHVSLRGLVAGWDGDHHRILRARMPLHIVSMVAFSAMVAVGARRRRLEQAAVLGLTLVPVYFNPANYYLHLVFLLPLLVLEDRRAALGARQGALWLVLLAMCVSQYLTVLDVPLGPHFYQATAILFAALAGLLGIMAWWPLAARELPAAAPHPAGPQRTEPPAEPPSAEPPPASPPSAGAAEPAATA
ncbi:MAG: hypothetical protein IT376_01785 [Polyangiaceae bacterium]|nr:hypothetical protein [Polyangiaceae bacterium]